MRKIEKTVFISYRRANSPWALLIYKDLRSEGYDVFIDYKGIASGAFENVIAENIQSRAHFLVLLTPSSLENTSKSSKDWMRFEIQTAFDCRRNVVPVALEGFDFADPTLIDKFTGEFEKLKHYNALSVPLEYFDAAMARLRDEFLNVELDAVAHPTSEALAKVVVASQAAADAAPAVTSEELTAQQWFERGYVASKPEGKIQYYSEAIRLNPEYAAAYNNRGSAHDDLGDFPAAIKDYDEAIRLNPEYADAYNNRGLLHKHMNNHESAERDLEKAEKLSDKANNAQ